MIELIDVSRHYPQKGGGEILFLEGINLIEQRGESLVITDPSGSGKSTL